MTGLNKKRRLSTYLIVLSIVIVLYSAGALIYYYYTALSTPLQSFPHEAAVSDRYFDMHVYYNKNINIPPLKPVVTQVLVYLEDKNFTNYTNCVKNLTSCIRPSVHLLYSSLGNSSSLLERTDFSRSDLKPDPKYREFITTLKASHNARVETVNQDFRVVAAYSIINGSLSNNTSLVLPSLTYTIKMEDFSTPAYLGIIVLGVFTSYYVGEYRNSSGGGKVLSKINSARIVLWIIFSIIIATLVFNQFRQQVVPTSDLVTNFGLAFAFGFGAERILSETPRVLKEGSRENIAGKEESTHTSSTSE